MTAAVIIPGLLLFNLLIIVHELGHLVAARRAGLTVTEFGVGMGPRLFGFQRGETEYVWRLLPIAGYVLLPDLAPDEDMEPVPAGKRLFALLGGPAANFAVAALLMGPRDMWAAAAYWFTAMADLLQGAPAGSELTGLVGTSQIMGEAAAMGWQVVVWMAGALSLNLGFMNLLPVPGLDGGRILGLLVERLNGGRRSRWEPLVHFLGLAAVLGLGLWVTGHEILRAMGWVS